MPSSSQAPSHWFAAEAPPHRKSLRNPPLEHYYTKVAGSYSCECISMILDWLFCACYQQDFEENRSGRLRLGENLSRFINVADELG